MVLCIDFVKLIVIIYLIGLGYLFRNHHEWSAPYPDRLGIGELADAELGQFAAIA